MFCPNCGNKIPDDAAFCAQCGSLLAVNQDAAQNSAEAPVQAAASEPVAPVAVPATAPVVQQAFTGPANPSFKKKAPLIVAAVAAIAVVAIVIVLIVSLFSGGGGGGFAYRSGDISTSTVDGSTYFFFNGGKSVYTDKYVPEYYNSTDLTTVAFVVDSELYYSKGEKFKKIDSDVDAEKVYVSNNGNSVYYVANNVLKLSKNGGKGEKVKDLEEYKDIDNFCISPDGNTAMFTLYDESAYEDGYLDSSKGKTYMANGASVGKEYIKAKPLCLSNGGSLIYATDNQNGKLVMYRGIKGEKETIASSYYGMVGASADVRAILYTAEKSGNLNTYYYDPSLKDSIKVCSGSIALALPYRAYAYNSLDTFVAYEDGETVKFSRKGEDFESERIAKTTYCALSEDGSYVVYLKSGNLYRKSIYNSDSEVKLASDVNNSYLWIDTSLKHFYYYDSGDDILYYVTDKEENKKKVCDDKPSEGIVNNSGVFVYMYDGVNVNAAVRGNKEKIKGVTDSEASEIGTCGNAFIIESVDRDAVFTASDGINFSKVKK